MTRARLAVLLAVAGAACNTNTINTPIRTFDRPADFALGCVQANQSFIKVFDARPITDCTPDQKNALQFPQYNDQTHPDSGVQTDSSGNTKYYTPRLFGLTANSARGELALVDVDVGLLRDLNTSTPGFGFLPVGKLPEHVRVSQDGCTAVTANTDSCDLAVVDLNTLYNEAFAHSVLDGGVPDGSALDNPGYGHEVVQRVVLTAVGKPIHARPTWIEFSPESRAGLHGFEPGGLAGQCTGSKPFAWVALPGCQLVAEVQLPSPEATGVTEAPIVRAVRITRDHAEVVSDLSTISCPAECGVDTSESGIADAGTPPDLAVPPLTRLPDTQANPDTLAIDTEGNAARLFIGDATGERMDVVPIDAPTGDIGQPRSLHLFPGALGVTVVRISPRSPAGKFLYAVARDATVRVVDLDQEFECETNPDPRAFQQTQDLDKIYTPRQYGCMPLGTPRSPLATSPGIQVPGNALPKDVAFVHGDFPDPVASNVTPLAAGPSLLAGDYAWIFTSDGRGTVVNIYDACPQPNIPQETSTAPTYSAACVAYNVDKSRYTAETYFGNPLPRLIDRISHRLRGGSSRFYASINQADNTGPPRFDDDLQPLKLTVAGVSAVVPADAPVPTDMGMPDLSAPPDMGVPGPQDGGLPSLAQYPLPDGDYDKTAINNPLFNGKNRRIAFYEPDRARLETWSISWEGTLPNTQRNLGRLHSDGQFLDAGGAFCSRGVRRGDKLLLVGCTTDSDCSVSQQCIHDPAASQAVPTGMCLDRNPQGMTTEQLAMECSPILRAVRRYHIDSAKQGATVDGSTLDVLQVKEISEPEHPIETTTCKTDQDCAAYPVFVTDVNNNAVPLATSCLPDWDGQSRCLRACSTQRASVEQQCGADFQCARASYDPGRERCIRAPIFDPKTLGDCLKEFQSYAVLAGDAYLVSGSLTGVLNNLQANPVTRECEPPPLSSEQVRLSQSRIPLEAAACPSSLTDPLGPLTDGPNVCQLPDQNNDRVIRFENSYFAIALRQEQSTAGRVLVPPDQTVMTFNVVGNGFPLSATLAADVQAQNPVAAVTAPDRQTIYIVDEGKQPTTFGLRGQVLKLYSPIQQVDRRFLVR
jgi:hypothetical protein